jgi:hypothetical protein
MAFANFNLPLTRRRQTDPLRVRRLQQPARLARRLLSPRAAGAELPSIYPLGFLPLIEPRVVDRSLTGGARGELATWFYDASIGYGENKFDFYVTTRSTPRSGR